MANEVDMRQSLSDFYLKRIEKVTENETNEKEILEAMMARIPEFTNSELMHFWIKMKRENAKESKVLLQPIFPQPQSEGGTNIFVGNGSNEIRDLDAEIFSSITESKNRKLIESLRALTEIR